MISRQRLYAMGEPLGDCCTEKKLGGGYRCGLGGGSSSSSAQTTNQYDNRVVQGQGAILAQGGSTLTVNATSLDANTVTQALNFGGAVTGRALDTVDATVHGAFSSMQSQNDSLTRVVTAANQQAAASVSQASDALAAAYSDAKGNNNAGITMIAIVVVGGLVALQALKK